MSLQLTTLTMHYFCFPRVSGDEPDVCPTNPCESWVHEYSLWADGYVWVVSDTTTGDSLAGIYADSEEDAIKYYTENYM